MHISNKIAHLCKYNMDALIEYYLAKNKLTQNLSPKGFSKITSLIFNLYASSDLDDFTKTNLKKQIRRLWNHR